LTKAKVHVKGLFLANRLFENFGISYYGPVDGHNIAQMIDIFSRVSAKDSPCIVHVVTKKGKGDDEAERMPDKFHGINSIENHKSSGTIPTENNKFSNISPIDNYKSSNIIPTDNNKSSEISSTDSNESSEISSSAIHKFSDTIPAVNHEFIGEQLESSCEKELSFSSLAAETLCEMAKEDEKIVCITAAMGLGTGMEIFRSSFEDRYFDVSIAEQHAVTLSAGLAAGGLKPYFAVYSTFLQRGFDQILHDVALNNLPVTFLIDRAGAVGSDGVTHQGIFDLSYLRIIPNLIIATPKDGNELVAMLKYSQNIQSPLAIRYPKSYKKEIEPQKTEAIALGKWEWLRESNRNIFVLASGSRMVEIALCISDVNVINARFIRPLDTELLSKINHKGNLIVTMEDNERSGGFGEYVLSTLNSLQNNQSEGARVCIFAHPNTFSDNRSVENMLETSGLSAKNIENTILDFLQSDNC
jgi:deoxyxylulose-5-phosphate synthase